MIQSLAGLPKTEKRILGADAYSLRPAQPIFHNVVTVAEAVKILSDYGIGAKIFAGGVDLVGLIKQKSLSASPAVFMNIKTIPDLKYIEKINTGLAIGATVKISEIEHSKLIREEYPALYESAVSIGSPQIRNMGTIAGNLLQDVRCWYYRRPAGTGTNFICHRKTPDGKCFAKEGENQNHAIFPSKVCMATCSSDLAVILSAMDAKARIISSNGVREVSISDLYPGSIKQLRYNEMITEILIPSPGTSSRQHFLKIRQRNAIDFAISSVAVVLQMNDDRVAHAGIALGGVALDPRRATDAENFLHGRKITEDSAEDVAKIALTDATPTNKNAYKAAITKALIKRALLGRLRG